MKDYTLKYFSDNINGNRFQESSNYKFLGVIKGKFIIWDPYESDVCNKEVFGIFANTKIARFEKKKSFLTMDQLCYIRYGIIVLSASSDKLKGNKGNVRVITGRIMESNFY